MTSTKKNEATPLKHYKKFKPPQRYIHATLYSVAILPIKILNLLTRGAREKHATHAC